MKQKVQFFFPLLDEGEEAFLGVDDVVSRGRDPAEERRP